MTTDKSNASAIRFLQEENLRLKNEHEELKAQLANWREYVRALDQLQGAGNAVQSESDLLTFLGQVVEAAVQTSHTSDGSLLLIDSDTDELVFVQVRGSISATLPGYRLQKGEGIAGWVAEHGTGQLVNDTYGDPRFQARVDERFQFITRNLIAVPIKGRKGVLGVVEVLNKLGDQGFSTQDLNMMTVLANMAAPAIESLEVKTGAR